MAKKEELKSMFGQRISGGSPAGKKAPTAKPVETNNGEQMISAQEAERRSRTGRKPSWDKSKRLKEQSSYTSLSLDGELYDKIREIARVNALPYKDIVNAALAKYIELYEAKNGPIIMPRESNISAASLI